MNNKTHRIVLTGGPGGGKTTAAQLIRRELGERIIVVPEAATMLFQGGFPRCTGVSAQVAAQKAIYHVQRNIEDIQRESYPGRVLLCDRGTIDSAAYWPHGAEDFFKATNTSLQKECDRYDAVVFFETAAVGNIAVEGTNPTRIEDNQEARDLDKRLQSYWSQHKNYHFVPHQKSFFHKLESALKAVQQALAKL